MLDLTGKTALVTGASSGIGAVTAQTLAKAGAKVFLAARRETNLRKVCDDLSGTRGDLIPCALNVADPSAISALASDLADQHGGPDILVNCAGISQTTLMKRTPDEELADIVETNLLAAILVSKHARIRPNGISHLLINNIYIYILIKKIIIII